MTQEIEKMIKRIIDKLLSARFLMAIFFSMTYCIMMGIVTVALLRKILSVETYVALVAAFALIVRQIADDYFNRDDRFKPENGGAV